MGQVMTFTGRSAIFLSAALALGTLNGCGKSDEKPSTPSSVKNMGGTRVGEVSTATKLVGSDHKVVVDAYPDPKIDGITIYVSRSQTGGLTGDFGLADEVNEASIATRQTGPIRVLEPLEYNEDVITEDRNITFKNLKITRMWDDVNGAFVYLVYSRGLVDGSPKNVISAVVPQTWEGVEADLSVLEGKGGYHSAPSGP